MVVVSVLIKGLLPYLIPDILGTITMVERHITLIQDLGGKLVQTGENLKRNRGRNWLFGVNSGVSKQDTQLKTGDRWEWSSKRQVGKSNPTDVNRHRQPHPLSLFSSCQMCQQNTIVTGEREQKEDANQRTRKRRQCEDTQKGDTQNQGRG